MNSDDVAATRRRHRFQAAVSSAVMIAPLSSWNCQHSNDQFTYLGDNAHSLVGILRWEPLPFVRSRHPTVHSWWFRQIDQNPFPHTRAQWLRPISGHIGHWAGDLRPCHHHRTPRRRSLPGRVAGAAGRAGLTPPGNATGGRRRRFGRGWAVRLLAMATSGLVRCCDTD